MQPPPRPGKEGPVHDTDPFADSPTEPKWDPRSQQRFPAQFGEMAPEAFSEIPTHVRPVNLRLGARRPEPATRTGAAGARPPRAPVRRPFPTQAVADAPRYEPSGARRASVPHPHRPVIPAAAPGRDDVSWSDTDQRMIGCLAVGALAALAMVVLALVTA